MLLIDVIVNIHNYSWVFILNLLPGARAAHLIVLNLEQIIV